MVYAALSLTPPTLMAVLLLQLQLHAVQMLSLQMPKLDRSPRPLLQHDHWLYSDPHFDLCADWCGYQQCPLQGLESAHPAAHLRRGQKNTLDPQSVNAFATLSSPMSQSCALKIIVLVG